MQTPRLRDNRGRVSSELYPIGQIPDDVIYSIGKLITYNVVIGKSDISGDDWGDIFAKAIDGKHLNRPLGIADVVYNDMAWSVKSVKDNRPLTKKNIRVISGRCSPDYSYGISDPHKDIQQTGEAVLNIWNERINMAHEKYKELRTCVLVRNFDTLEFLLFENEAERFIVTDYRWETNKSGNLEGYNARSNRHSFTWQPHGSQFTVLLDIPVSVKKFKIKRPPVLLDVEDTMKSIHFDQSWVTIL